MKELLDEIKNFDTDPAIFKACVIASSTESGYTAYVDFRTTDKSAPRSVSTHGETPEEALTNLLNALREKWGKCPYCGQYKHDTAVTR